MGTVMVADVSPNLLSLTRHTTPLLLGMLLLERIAKKVKVKANTTNNINTKSELCCWLESFFKNGLKKAKTAKESESKYKQKNALACPSFVTNF